MKNNLIQYSWHMRQVSELELLGRMCANSLQPLVAFDPVVIYLQGSLGAGKTTFARALIQQLGEKGHVRSPSFSIVETYVLQEITILHLDLYRCRCVTEWIDIGLDDYCDQPNTIWLVEWPDNAAGSLPVSDITILLEIVDPGRQCSVTTHSNVGKMVIEPLAFQWS